LGVYGATRAQAEKLVPGILDTAAAMKEAGVSSESAARMVGMFLETGKAGRLSRLGIVIRPEEVAALGRAGALAAAMERAFGGGLKGAGGALLPAAGAAAFFGADFIPEVDDRSLLRPVRSAAVGAAEGFGMGAQEGPLGAVLGALIGGGVGVGRDIWRNIGP